MSPPSFSSLARRSQNVIPAEDLQNFLDTFLYREPAVLLDEITHLDPETGRVRALLDTARALPFAASQRVTDLHPAHVSGAELVMATGSLGCLHAYFFHGCRWDQGWAGFGNRIHRADFKQLARIGPVVELNSQETKTRIGPSRVVIRFTFEFFQDGNPVYVGDQSAMFVKNKAIA
ncbi:MAG TPA: hypothetical protein EYQ54_01645 [Myxococcales bacterium]|nr:hypothetical protein [Myxococcales bacterium]